MTVTPIFVLSLPRSGSTLVQRVMAAHDGVATAAEPWVALPQIYALRDGGAFTEYGHALATRAIRDFAASLDGGEARYRAEVRRFIERLYQAASAPDDRWFVDKTPRYHFIADELFEMFPRARFVFVWRNPLSVAASTVQTWGHGRWMVDRWRVDLFDGLDRLVSSHIAHEDRAHAVRYEDLLTRPEETWGSLFDHCGIPFDPASLERFGNVELEARMGDPTGRRQWDQLRTEPLERWKSVMTSPLRTRWCRDYLRWIGPERLAHMGYDSDALLDELAGIHTSLGMLASDVARTVYARGQRTGREFAGRLLWKGSRGGEAHSVYENGQTSRP
jgi:Sulfotransferase family